MNEWQEEILAKIRKHMHTADREIASARYWAKVLEESNDTPLFAEEA